MKKLSLLSTAAAIVMLSGGVAFAQDLPGGKEGAAPAPAAQQNAPAEKVAPAIRPGRRNIPETTGQGSPASQNGNATVERRGASESQRGERNEQMGAGGKADNHRATTGQGAAGAAKLSHEQRTRITTIFHRHRVAPARLNISVRVGARVPTSVRFYPVPTEVIEIYPEWRGYDYVYVGEQILIVDPDTHEIVAILEA